VEYSLQWKLSGVIGERYLNNSPTNIQAETAASVLETVREEYLCQERRHDLLIAKTQTLATVGTVLFTAAAAALFTLTNAKFSICWMNIAFALSFAGIVACLVVLMSQTFRRIKYAPALVDSELSKPPGIVRGNLAKTYHEAITGNDGPLRRLVWIFDLAVIFLILSLICGGISVFSSPKGEESLSNNNKPSTGSQPSQQPPQQPTQTESYGTDTLKKSETPTHTRPKISGSPGKKKK